MPQFINTEYEKNPTMLIQEIKPLGYGNPDASISYAKQIESGELRPEVARKAVELIMSGECLVDVTEQDDGCIDGRTAAEVMFVNDEGEIETRPIMDDAHERQKVAGGGYLTALAMYRALQGSSEHIDKDLARTVKHLSEQGVFCGAHTGAHGSDEKTDCGANDRVAEIFENGDHYQKQISADVAALLGVAGLDYDATVMQRVVSGWSMTLSEAEYFEGSTGTSRLDAIMGSIQALTAAQKPTRPLAVLKHLTGDHNEDFIYINYIEGKTFSQAKFREKLAEVFPDLRSSELAQIFVVDVPRIVTLAQAMGSNEEEREIALYAGVAYQLATAATLTDGTLRNFVGK